MIEALTTFWKTLTHTQRIIVGLCLLLLVGGGGIFIKKNKTISKKTPIVQTITVKKENIPQKIQVPATLMAHTEVLIRSRVDGQIKTVHFQEGQIVEENAPLFTIDDDLLEAQLKQAQANVEKTTALLEQSKKELERNGVLLKKGVITQSVYDQLEATVKGYEATFTSDKASVESLKLQISYSHIKSPFKGIVSFLKVQAGNFVRQAEATPLVSIAQVSPIDVILDVPEKFLPQILKNGIQTVSVSLLDVNGTPIPNTCQPVAIDQGVNVKSGVFSLKVTVENNDFKLRPGMSVTGILTIGTFQNALTLPEQAVLMGQESPYVYVVDPKKQTIKRQNVKILHSADKILILQSGVQENDEIVLEGQINLKDGMTVQKQP